MSSLTNPRDPSESELAASAPAGAWRGGLALSEEAGAIVRHAPYAFLCHGRAMRWPLPELVCCRGNERHAESCGVPEGGDRDGGFAAVAERVELAERACPRLDEATLAHWIKSQAEDGSWPDLRYDDESAASWSPGLHLDRLQNLAAAYGRRGYAREGDSATWTAIERGVDCWLARRPVSSNWWWNEIGTPQRLGSVLVMTRERIGAERITRGLELLPVDFPPLSDPKGVGLNRAWFCEILLFRGLLENSSSRVAHAVEGLRPTLIIGPGEGIQRDFSYHQHMSQLYNGGYGFGFVRDIARWFDFVRGTAWALDGEALAAYRGLLLDGTGWMTRYGTLDLITTGREITRPDADGRAAKLIGAIDTLIAAGGPDTRAEALRRHVSGDRSEPYATGVKLFPRSDYVVQRHATHLASLRMFSTRTTGTEEANGENLLGYYLPYGVTLFYSDGT
jgi:chondroitin AC lyase